jgi:protein CWC15
MILAFYLFIKILLKNIFLELIFNKDSIKNLNKKGKLNIKMIVSILYRGLINYFKENVDPIKNVEELEKIDDINNFMKIPLKRKEFKFNKLLKKRYYLKTTHIQKKNNKRSSIRNKKKIDDDYEKRSKRKTKKTQKKRNKRKKNKNNNDDSNENSSNESSSSSNSSSYESEENSENSNETYSSKSKYFSENDSSTNSYYDDEEENNNQFHSVKNHLLGKAPHTKVLISNVKPLQQGKNVLIDLEKEDIENMHTIIENSQSFGNDIDPNEIKIMSNVLYDENALEIYYLYAEEYNFDPIKNLIEVVDNLLIKIENNFNNKNIKYYDDNEYINIY